MWREVGGGSQMLTLWVGWPPGLPPRGGGGAQQHGSHRGGEGGNWLDMLNLRPCQDPRRCTGKFTFEGFPLQLSRLRI